MKWPDKYNILSHVNFIPVLFLCFYFTSCNNINFILLYIENIFAQTSTIFSNTERKQLFGFMSFSPFHHFCINLYFQHQILSSFQDLYHTYYFVLYFELYSCHLPDTLCSSTVIRSIIACNKIPSFDCLSQFVTPVFVILSSNSLSNCFLSFWKNKMIDWLVFQLSHGTEKIKDIQKHKKSPNKVFLSYLIIVDHCPSY
jgi:hypothetical protein